MLLWLIKFSWASLQIPTAKPLPAILIVLSSPLFFPCTYFLDLKEPLILYSDLACLNHAQPLLEPEQRKHLQGFVKIVEPYSLNYVKRIIKEHTCHILFPYLFFLLQEGNIGKEKQNTKTKFEKPFPGKPKSYSIDFRRLKQVPFALVMECTIFLKIKDKFLCNDNKNMVMF